MHNHKDKIKIEMINLKELRLNNWVYSLEIGEYVKIASIDSDCVTLKDHVTWGYVYADMIEPIEIDEETLLDFGLEKLENGAFKVGKRYLYYSKIDKVWYLNASPSLAQFHNISSINYIHELQNVYYWSSKDDCFFELREELKIGIC